MNLRRDCLNALMWLAKIVFHDFLRSGISASCYIKLTEQSVQMADMGLRVAGPLCSQAPCSRAWRSFVGPVGTTQGAGSVTAVPTYIMWLMAAIKIVEATANIKKHHRNFFFFYTSRKIASPAPTS